MSGVQVPFSLEQLTQLVECLAYNEEVSGSKPLLFKLLLVKPWTIQRSVGALTLKPFSNESREWELLENESFDISDGFGVSLRASIREDRIFLMEPRDIELPWLTDRGRLFFEGFFDSSGNPQGSENTEWSDVFEQVSSTLYFLDHFKFSQTDLNSNFLVIAFKRVSEENLDILNRIESRFSFVKLLSDRSSLKNVSLEESYQLTDVFSPNKLKFSSLSVLVGTNTRYEGYVLNLSLRQRYLKGGFTILSLGPLTNLTIPSTCVGSSLKSLFSLYEGTLPACREVARSTIPLVLTNTQFLAQLGDSNLQSVLLTAGALSNPFFNLSVMPDRIESTGINDSKNYKSLTFKEILNSNYFYYLNMDLGVNPEFKRLVDFNLLGVLRADWGYETKKTKSVFAQSDVLAHKNLLENPGFSVSHAAGLETTAVLRFLPTKGFFGENSTYKTVQGLTKKSIKASLTQFSLR